MENKYCDYKNLQIEMGAPEEVNEELVEQEIQKLLDQGVEQVEKEGKAENGDIVTIDFEGFVDGVAFEGGKGENYDLELGSGTFIPGFEDQLVGAEVGQDVDVNVSFPENYQAENLAGKPAVFKCKVYAIKQKVVPTFDDEFAKKFNMPSAAELKDAVRREIADQNQSKVYSEYIQNVCDYLVENSELEVLEDAITSRVEEMVAYYRNMVAQYGTTLEDYLKMVGTEFDAFKDSLKAEAEKSIKVDMVYNHIADEENFVASEEEIQSTLDYVKNRYGASDEQLAKFKEEKIEDIKSDIRRQKVSEMLIKNHK